MIFLTKQMDPVVREILEDNQQVNGVFWLKAYMDSFIHFVLCAVFTIIGLVFTAYVVYKIFKYFQADFVRSKEIQHLLQVRNGLTTVETRTNTIVKGATVRFNANRVIIKVPTKCWWEVFENVGCRHEIRRRLESLEFKEMLATHYHGYRFGDIESKENCYILMGEVY